MDPQQNYTTFTKPQCDAKFFEGYRWNPTGTYHAGVCRDAANKPTYFTRTECEQKFVLGYKWDKEGDQPPACQPTKAVINGECVSTGNVLGTCRYEHEVYGTPTVELTRTTDANCNPQPPKTWHKSTQAEFNAEVAANCKPPMEIKNGNCVQPEEQEDDGNSGSGGEEQRDTKYKYLSPLPETGEFFETDLSKTGGGLAPYLNAMIKIFIGICAVLAVIMIILGGLEYMTSELISSKEHGRERIVHAVFGLILALGAWTILNQINPELLKADLASLEEQKIIVELEPEIGVPTETITTVEGQQIKACDETQLMTVSLFGSNVRVRKSLASSLIRINAKWSTMPNKYKANSVGGYNCRKVSGTNSWSAHAFGLALDINPSTNPFGKEKKTDMPPEFVKLFTSEGWGWGGNWSHAKDPMHFSKFPSEGGDGVI